MLVEEPFPTALLDSEKRHKVVPKCVRNSMLVAQPEGLSEAEATGSSDLAEVTCSCPVDRE